jgi:hypothetical protein
MDVTSTKLSSPNQTVTSKEIYNVNRYNFNSSTMWTAYGLAIGFSIIANILGIVAFCRNDASHDMSLSTILSISRDQQLDGLFPQCAHGRLPLPKETMSAELKIIRMTDNKGWSLQPTAKDRKQSVCIRCVGEGKMSVAEIRIEAKHPD